MATPLKSTPNKIKIAIMVAQESEDMEVIVPYDLWKRAGISVEKISVEKKNTITLQSGTKIYCEEILEKTNLDRFTAIYLPGGRGHEKFLDEKFCKKLHEKLLKFADDEKKWVLAMCASPIVLMRLNVAKNRKMTVYPSFSKELGPNYIDESVVVDGNFITGRAPGSSIDFSLTVIEKFLSKQVAMNVSNAIIHKK